MNQKIFPIIGGAIGIVIIGVFASIQPEAREVPDFPILAFTYEETNQILRDSLEGRDISMSTELKFSGLEAISEYCKFFEEEEKQNLIQYCTSTELLDSEGNFLGNIHIVGSESSPQLVISLIQADPFMNQLNDIKTTFSTLFENLVCNCWEEVRPGNYPNLNSWIEDMKEKHVNEKKITTKSDITVAGKTILLEVSTNFEGYLWKFFIQS